MNINEITYWVTLASMPKMYTRRKNELYVSCFTHTPQYSIIDLFERQEIRRELGVTPEEEMLFIEACQYLANNAFLVEDLINQGYDILPLTSPDYPKALKNNLKRAAPCVVYVKGDKGLLNTASTAIVGSRKANATSLAFTINIAQKATNENRTVVSGFAKGVDRQALDATIQAHGKSIIVLPQGITTFTTGYKQYYQQIYQGQVTVISTFHPKAPWSKELAMARNSIIYGLSTEIYAAESDCKGGTWSGVIEGLNKGQKIYVRRPQAGETNANLQLIQKGGIGVDMYGNILKDIPDIYKTAVDNNYLIDYNNQPIVDNESSDQKIKILVLSLLTGKKMSKQILAEANLDWSDARMKRFLRSLSEVGEEKKAGKILFFKLGYEEPSLFNENF